MEKILALDLGSNSIGATIRNTSDRENQFDKTTVITFETGVGKDDKGKYTESRAALRTSKRSVRRLYQSRKYKLWSTLEILMNKGYCPIGEESLKRWKTYKKEEAVKGNGGRAYPVEDLAFANWIKLDFNGDGKPDFTSPYQLRAKLLTEKLDFNIEENMHILGRALYHIAQHRGFKSSKKVQNKDERDDNDTDDIEQNVGAEVKKEKRFYNAIQALKLGIDIQKQVGEIFSTIEKQNEKNHNIIRIRKELHQYVTRKLLMREVKEIFEFQKLDFNNIFEGKTVNQSAIFWQRPLRSQKGSVGKCTLEPNKYRCPVSQPSFEEFRAWGFLNNIQYKTKDDNNSKWEQIPIGYREKLYHDKFFRISVKDFDFFEIAEWIRKENQHDRWELNYPYKTNVSTCLVSAKLKDIFGENWQDFKLETHKIKTVRKKDGSIKEHTTTYNIEDIWHILFDGDDEDEIEAFAIETLNLDEKKLKKFIALFKSMPVAYSMLSLKAIENILPFLREGFIYTEATLLAKVPKILGDEVWGNNKANILSSLKTEVIDKNRNEKRILNIVNNLIAKYKALPAQDKFAERDYAYVLGERDFKMPRNSDHTDENEILMAVKESFGEYSWKSKEPDEQNEIIQKVTGEYQSFFSDMERDFKKLPHLQKSMKQFLADNFSAILYCPNTFRQLREGEEKCRCTACKKLDSLYHPSQIDIYPPAKPNSSGKILLGSPVTGAFKNPMALRALHELRRYVNYLITTEQIDEQTRIVVELAREHKLDDNNRRWAWDVYQTRRREENKEFRDAIYELIKDPGASGSIVNADSESDIDKFRIWYEMIGGEDANEVFEKDKKIILLEKSTKAKKNKKGAEEEIEEFNNDDYLRINKSFYFKLQKAKDNIQVKYQLWKEQECQCIYTGKIIRITDLFQENLIDFEHTIPRSKSFDNSLANLTVCYADYNRNIKKNQIPFSLPNYNFRAHGYDAIKPRLEKWQQKVKDLKLHVDFWKTKSKRATTKEDKDAAIRQQHLWQFELNYWHDKVSRFTMEEIKGGFKKSQLVDTQIISKYAMHYLKTVFNSVDVQKGAVTAEFRKIFGVQEIGTPKDRSMHSHHAKDAIVLSLIPTPAIREQMLKLWFEIAERKTLQEDVSLLEEQLQQLKYQCNLPNVNAIIEKIDERILINNVIKDQTLTLAKKRLRSRGKIVQVKDEKGDIIYKTDEAGNKLQRKSNDGKLIWKTNENGELKFDENGDTIPVYEIEERWAKGDAIRGELHLATYYGKIKKAQRDNEGNALKDDNGRFKIEGLACVIRKEVNKDLNIDKIVDPHLKSAIVAQLNGRTINTTINEDGGLWMLKKDGSKAHKIRHIRCYADDVTNPIPIKKQTYQGLEDHKNYYWAKNGENIICALYQKMIKDKKGLDKIDRELEIITLKDAAALLSLNLVDTKRRIELYRKDRNNEIILDESGNTEKPYALLKPGMKVIFFDKYIEELKRSEEEKIADYHKRLSPRIYLIRKFAGGQISFQHHLEARDDDQLKKAYPDDGYFKSDEKGKVLLFGKRGINGFTEKITDFDKLNNGKPWPRLIYTKDWLTIAIEDKNFEIRQDGEIKWL